MKVENVINETGQKYSPYMGGLVNHLPMAQWAVYKLSGEEDKKVDNFTKKYLQNARIDKVKEEYKKANSLEEALGNRSLYEGTLDLLKEKAQTEDIKELTKKILNKYKFGMSSGLFHTLIRVAYGVEGYNEKEKLKEELIRGLAYYITAYRESKLFKREIVGDDIFKEIKSLSSDVEIREILNNNNTLGQRIKGLYNSKIYLEKGFIIKGDADEKIKSLLSLLVPLYYKKGNIVILHCITSIHAMIILKDYYENYKEAIDILTTSILTHLIATEIYKYPKKVHSETGFSWNCLKEKAIKSKDVHDIKLTYSASVLDKIYEIDELKDISIKRIRHS
ncbi:MAG: questin oxidase family protein [Tissierella sp.]|uniref:questin oxidase family protein n=1 Tax=Tissierella sp. TaxID=41274 RepID=UPI003F9A3EB5